MLRETIRVRKSADRAVRCDGSNGRTSATQAASGWPAELLPPSGRLNWLDEVEKESRKGTDAAALIDATPLALVAKVARSGVLFCRLVCRPKRRLSAQRFG